ncbi:hypothetical protein D3870_06575 [Noviherbaspirillum cavernae]|uniref:Uncharacterized protein n=2 Tax=Noviherbaspirillum cavernae TaxID=2320862 RepID=A0A418X081_9BURK|nr:hypothetical protein D3870_06575 [Noviherbaspirillum cavernae]
MNGDSGSHRIQAGTATLEPFSLVRGDLFFRLQRRLGLIPADGSGILRRAVLYSMLCWLPLVVWAWVAGRMLPGDTADPLLAHYDIHVRCLVSVPLMILAEGTAQAIVPTGFSQFLRRGIVDGNMEPAFRDIIASGIRLRDRVYPWIMIAGLVLAWTTVTFIQPDPDEISWAKEGADGRSFGAWWFLLVVRPVFSILLLVWFWRLILLGIVLFRIARLPLLLVPSHPDRLGGLGFLCWFSLVFSPLVLALSAAVAAHWAHAVLHHGVQVSSLYVEMATLAVVLVLLTIVPLFSFTPLLSRTRRQALADYGVLLALHGRKVRQRWILGERVEDDGLLGAPELGPVADTQTLYQSVTAMQIVPASKASLIAVAGAAILPMAIVIAIQWPLQEILIGLVKTLL